MRGPRRLPLIGGLVATGLLALGVVAVPTAAQAATVQQTVTFGPGTGNFRIPGNATGITMTLAGGSGYGGDSSTDSGGTGGRVSLSFGASYAGVPFQYEVGAQGSLQTVSGSGDHIVAYLGGGGGSAISSGGSVVIVVGGGGGGGGSLAGPFAGGAGGVPDPSGFRSSDGGDGRGPTGIAAGGHGGLGDGTDVSVPLSNYGGGGGTGMPAGQAGDDPIPDNRLPPGQDFEIAPGGAAGVAGEFSSCGGGGSGYAGGGGGGDNGRPGCGAGGGGSGHMVVTGSSVSRTAAGTNVGDGFLTLTFSVPELVVAPPQLPQPHIGEAFRSDPFAVSGGATSAGVARYQFAVVAGTLPDGVDIDPFTGRIQGTPTAAGDFPVTVEVTEANSPAPQTVDVPLTLSVVPDPLAAVAGPGATGRVGQPLSWIPATATGGVAPYTWSLAAGALPAGTSLDPATGVVSGIPTGTGTSTVSLRVRDAQSPAQEATSGSADLALSTTPITGPGSVRRGASGSVGATGLVVGSYAIDLDGAEIGTTTVPASGVLAAAPVFPASAALGSHTLSVLYQGVEVGRTTVRVDSAALAVTPAVLPDARQGDAYAGTPVTTSGGLAPLVFSAAAPLPAGLVIDPATGALSGTPTVSGGFLVEVRVEDAESPSESATVSTALTIAPALLQATGSPANGHVGEPFDDAPVTATGGLAPLHYAVDPTTPLPAGLALDGATGRITGVPTGASAGSVTVAVTDADQPAQSASVPVALTITQLTVRVSSPVAVGDAVVVTGDGFDLGDYTVELHSAPVVLGATSVGSGGALRFTGTVPASVDPGLHQVQVLRAGVVVASAPITVLAAARGGGGASGAAGGSRVLADTGLEGTAIAGSTLAGLLLVLAGLALRVLPGRAWARAGRSADTPAPR